MTELPASWVQVLIVELLSPTENGNPFQQGWSPQCEAHPAKHGQWGVLKTTAIQHGAFWPHENKALPESLAPKSQIEIKVGDVLMTCAGPRNRCGVACLVETTPPKLMMSGKMYRFRPNPAALLPKYLAYLIRRRESQLAIDKMKTGISDSGLNLTHDRFAKLPVPLPPLPEQHRIVARIEELFSELDASVESLTKARALLGLYRQSLLKAAFQGKLTADWRAANPDKLEPPETLLSRIRKDRDARHANSEAAQVSDEPGDDELPRGWLWLSLDQVIASSLIGLVRSSAEQNSLGLGVNYIKMDRIDMAGRVDLSPQVFVEANSSEINRYSLEQGDILFNTRNSLELVGKTGLVSSDPPTPTVFNNNLMRLRALSSIDASFLGSQMSAPAFRRRMDKVKKATTSVAAVYGKDLWPLPVAVPTFAEQREIVRILDEKLSVLNSTETEIIAALTRIAALRQSILKRAFSGRLVPQDPSDEPASVLLARLQSQSPATPARRRRGA
jgi:type I restriction enzyme, S subunit